MKLLLPLFFVATLALTFSLAHLAPKHHLTITTDLINRINAHKSTWKAGENFANRTIKDIRSLVGVLPKSTSPVSLPIKQSEIKDDDVTIPEHFDAREQWPDCADKIGHVRDQANCGSCWAIAAVEVMSDRICIHSADHQQVSLSASDLMSCCTNCGNGCNGGWLEPTWVYWNKHGITTGGDYGSNEGCKPYPFPQCDHHVENGNYEPCGNIEPTPKCDDKCTVNSEEYATNKHYAEKVYTIINDEIEIQKEIMAKGPVECSLDVYEDFLTYNSGVYQHLEGEYVGEHAMKIIGWGVEKVKDEENNDIDVPYWLIANSWNEDWGEQGFIRFLRGSNHVGIESNINTGMPAF